MPEPKPSKTNENQPRHHPACRAFTLTELLITVAILGIISTFTLAKVLSGPTSAQKYKAQGKAALIEVQNAYTKFRLDNAPLTTTGPKDLTPYINYVKVDTVSVLDLEPGSTSTNKPCYGVYSCLNLHSGGTLRIGPYQFGNSASTNMIYFYFDPNGKFDGDYSSLRFFLYFDGRVKTDGTISPNTQTFDTNAGTTDTYSPDATREASWWNLN